MTETLLKEKEQNFLSIVEYVFNILVTTSRSDKSFFNPDSFTLET